MSNVPLLFENDEWPNPYTSVNIDASFYDSNTLVEKFASYSHPIFLSLNVQSLMSKHEKLNNFILNLVSKNVPIYVIAVQEIWAIHVCELVDIPGFNFTYKARQDGRGGGVGFYVKQDIQFREINLCQFIESQFENLIIEVTIDKKKFLLCNIYRSPNVAGNVSLRDLIETYNNRLDELQQKLNRYQQHTAIIFSDCNINVLKINNSPLAAEYLDTCHTNGFMLTSMKASRINPNSYSLIDHILINNVTNDIVSGSIVCDISDHFPIF
jgi:hypothetical protein